MGRPSPKRAPAEELERMLGLYRDKYADFTVKHFHEQMQKRHNYVLGYTVRQYADPRRRLRQRQRLHERCRRAVVSFTEDRGDALTGLQEE
jgi:hypothetical protein